MAASAYAAQESAPTATAGFQAALLTVQEGTADGELEQTAEGLARLPGSAEALLTAWAQDGLGSSQARLLELTAAQIGGREALEAVSSGLRESPDAAWRCAALRFIEPHAMSREMSVLADLIQEARVEDEDLLDAFGAALVATLERDLRAFEDLDRVMGASPHARSTVVHAVGRAGDPEGLAWLADQLTEPDVASVTLQEIGRLAALSGRSDPGIQKRVRPFLRSKDAGLRRQAARTAVALGDTAAVADLIKISSLPRESEQRMAFSALRDLTGRRLPDRSEAWQAWYEDEQSWMETEAATTLERLDSESDAEVVAAVHAISLRGLHRDALAAKIGPLLHDHPSAPVRGKACLALQRLGSARSLWDLAYALDDEDPTVRANAHAALRGLTGRALPADRHTWEADLAGVR